jgi:hypothetical protein
MMKLIGAGVSFAIAADAMGYAVKGFVSLQAWPTSSEIVEEYANTDVKRIEHAATQIRIRQIKEGIQQFCIPEGAVVEIQSLPKFEVVGRGKIDKEGRFEVALPSKDSIWRAYCKYEREEFGRTVLYVGASRIYKKRNFGYYEANIVLMRTYTSVEGRCVNKDGVPVKDVKVLVHPITLRETESQNEILWSTQIAVTGADGKWRVDGLISPPIDYLSSYICNAKLWHNIEFLHCPMELKIEIWRALPYRREVQLTIPNITDGNRRAAEKAIEISERRLGKKYDLSNRIMNFPVSTNNVIYVPDIVLPDKKQQVKDLYVSEIHFHKTEALPVLLFGDSVGCFDDLCLLSRLANTCVPSTWFYPFCHAQ